MTLHSPDSLFATTTQTSVMTYNIKNGNDRAHWSRRRIEVANVILGVHPLLLGTQEGNRSQLDYLKDHLPNYDYVGRGRDTNGKGEFSAIFYDRTRVTILDSGSFWLSPTPDVFGSRTRGETLPRIATWICCRISGHDHDLMLINTHLTNREVNIPAQIAVLAEQIGNIAEPSLDVLMTGDFNIGRHREHIQPLGELGFVDAWSFADRAIGPRFTYAGWREWSEEDAAAVEEENRIDWILYRPGDGRSLPTNVEVRTINTHARRAAPSDHFPVVLQTCAG